MTRLIILIILIISPLIANAFDGDYVWEEKFNRELPKANQGDENAQLEIGEMYNRGRGTAKNPIQAFEWYLKAANQGNTKAAYKIGYAYLVGKGVPADFTKAMSWLTIASNKGYERAHYYLGEIYELGKGVDVDLKTALTWYEKASGGGFDPATKRIQRVEEAMAEKAKPVEVEESPVARIDRKQISKTPEPKVNAQKVSMKSPVASTKEKLLVGGWKKQNKPSEFLPSKITNCVTTGISIECESTKQTRSIGVADINYTTKAILFGIKPTGEFKISYRNNVVAVDITDPEFAESGAEVSVKTGWQDAKHTLTCEILNDKSITCKKDKIRTIKFSR